MRSDSLQTRWTVTRYPNRFSPIDPGLAQCDPDVAVRAAARSGVRIVGHRDRFQ